MCLRSCRQTFLLHTYHYIDHNWGSHWSIHRYICHDKLCKLITLISIYQFLLNLRILLHCCESFVKHLYAYHQNVEIIFKISVFLLSLFVLLLLNQTDTYPCKLFMIYSWIELLCYLLSLTDAVGLLLLGVNF